MILELILNYLLDIKFVPIYKCRERERESETRAGSRGLRERDSGHVPEAREQKTKCSVRVVGVCMVKGVL